MNRETMKLLEGTAREIHEFIYVDGRKKKGDIYRTEKELREFLEEIARNMWDMYNSGKVELGWD